MKLSVIIPACMEPHLQKTVDSMLKTSELGSELEIITILDGSWQRVDLRYDPQVKVIQFEQNQGMRAAINAGISEAKGEFILKVDAHCAFGPGFDRIMIDNCERDWVMVPRRYSLSEDRWGRDRRHGAIDYHYLNYPTLTVNYGYAMTPHAWPMKSDSEIDDLMTYQGSCWMVNREYFLSHFGLLDERPDTYGRFSNEQVEVGLKYWLSGGQVKINKKTWYAHLAKTARHYAAEQYDRGYKINDQNMQNYTWVAKHWTNNREPNMVHPFSWLIEKFWTVPGWPADRNLWRI